jgi:hypothetical protein
MAHRTGLHGVIIPVYRYVYHWRDFYLCNDRRNNRRICDYLNISK